MLMCAWEGCEIKDTRRMQNISKPNRQGNYCSQVPKELYLIVSPSHSSNHSNWGYDMVWLKLEVFFIDIFFKLRCINVVPGIVLIFDNSKPSSEYHNSLLRRIEWKNWSVSPTKRDMTVSNIVMHDIKFLLPFPSLTLNKKWYWKPPKYIEYQLLYLN